MKWLTTLTVLTLCFSFNAFSKSLKVAIIAPEGTAWVDSLKKMAKEVKKETDGNVKFRIYAGGSQGDEPEVLRKVRIGQLHGGFFTGKTLGDINGNIRMMEVPFNFNGDRKKAWNTLKGLQDYYNKDFKAKGFVNLGFFELGSVYLVSKKRAQNLDDLKGIKIWTWEGDKLVNAMMKSLHLVSIPLALPDVLSSLSTGMIDAAYAPPMGIMALQWQNKVKYIVDFPIAYSVGAFLIRNKDWAKISPENQKKVEKIFAKHADLANNDVIEANKQALAAMKSIGIEFIKFPDSELKQSSKIRADVISRIKGNLVSEDMISRFNKEIKKL